MALSTETKIQFIKIRPVHTPTRANNNDAGTDFYIPDCTPEFMQALMNKNSNTLQNQVDIHYDQEAKEISITLGPHAQINIPSGIKVNILNKDTFLGANNKSGIATKYHLINGATIVDADYRGEVHLNMINTGNTAVTIKSGQKITQFIQQYYMHTSWEEISEEEYNNLETTDRGAGGFGSTGLQ